MKSNEQRESMERTRFFLKNLIQGLVWLGLIVGGYFYLKSHYDFNLEDVLGPLYDQPLIIYTIFFFSEIIFGLIPPELFMIWALRDEVLINYALDVGFLAILSYLGGSIGYYIGSHFSTTKLYRTLQKNYLTKYENHLNKFGGFLVVVAAMTPLPYSGICMLMGAIKYPYKRFLLMSTARLLRFAIYGFIIWEANVFQ